MSASPSCNRVCRGLHRLLPLPSGGGVERPASERAEVIQRQVHGVACGYRRALVSTGDSRHCLAYYLEPARHWLKLEFLTMGRPDSLLQVDHCVVDALTVPLVQVLQQVGLVRLGRLQWQLWHLVVSVPGRLLQSSHAQRLVGDNISLLRFDPVIVLLFALVVFNFLLNLVVEVLEMLLHALLRAR